MAYFRCTGEGGGGASPVITFTPKKFFDESGIGSSGWVSTDGETNMSIQGTFSSVVGEKVVSNSTNELRMYFPITGSYYLFGIRCKINPNFTPKNTNNWYECSCIIGQELGGTQKDCAVVIDKNGYFALGTDTATVNSTTVNALDGNEHTIFMLVNAGDISLYIDGVLEKQVSITMNGGEMNNLGVFFNVADGWTRTDGEIYSVGYWEENMPILTYQFPTI